MFIQVYKRIICDIMVVRNSRKCAVITAISVMAKRHLFKPGSSYAPTLFYGTRRFAAREKLP